MRLEELAGELVDVLAGEDPLNELLQGYPGYEDRLPDIDEAAGQRLRDHALRIAREASGLDPGDEVTRGVVIQQAGAVATRFDARLVEHTMVNHLTAPFAILSILSQVEGGNLLARLESVPGFLASAAERHRAGVAAGRLPVGSLVRAAIGRIDAYLADPAADRLRRPETEDVLDRKVRPAVAAYRAVLHDELASAGRPDDRPGLCWLPGGSDTYAALVRMHTTTGRNPDELHRTGLELIERLAGEYREIGAAALGTRSVDEVRQRMRTDPALRFRDAAEVLSTCRSAMDRAEAVLPRWFARLPTHRCGLAPVPELDAPTASSAGYQPGPLDGSRPGVFHVNTYRASERDRCVAEANTFHEAVGHHIQITLAQQLTGVPTLRRVAWINPYMEGFALYCERLADEMNLYSDHVARLGMLANDSMRAARLVVDTGLHHLGWPRHRAVDYLRTNTVMSEVEIQSETDRYIESPGQALSYMIGRLELDRLRARTERALGTSFDIRAFHDLILSTGPVPMAVLDDVVAL
jgi:uncharacterized protein (DUF885 family)